MFDCSFAVAGFGMWSGVHGSELGCQRGVVLATSLTVSVVDLSRLWWRVVNLCFSWRVPRVASYAVVWCTCDI